MTENKRKNIKTLLLYSTSGCHLCEQAKTMIDFILLKKPNLFALEVLDIANNDGLFEKYGVRIPVIRFENNGSELSWPFDMNALNEFVQ